MSTSAQQEKRQPANAALQAVLSVGAPLASFEDNRAEAVAQRRLQAMVDASPHAQRMGTMQMHMNACAPAAVQTEAFVSTTTQFKEGAAPKTNNTGLPDRLKAGVESLSGMSMDHVKVHYNSAKPAQLNAHAYAQGSDIHVAPGQERHLPHEAWHVVQQRQGRVQASAQCAGAPLNDDPGLESEADLMGAKAHHLGSSMDAAELSASARQAGNAGVSQLQQPVQRRVGFEFQTNIKLRKSDGRLPTFKTPLLQSENWHIECDSGDLEFVTAPLNDYEDVHQVLAEIVHWANTLAQVKGEIPEAESERLSSLLNSKYPDEVAEAQEDLKDSETRPLGAMPQNEESPLGSMFAVGRATEMTASPQTTIGIPLDRIISALHLVAAEKTTVGAHSDKPMEVSLASAQNGNEPPLVSAHDATVNLVEKFRKARPQINDEATWRKLEGVIGLAASYIRTANVAGRRGYGYTKIVAPMMSRVNFSALFAELPEQVRPFFNAESLAAASGITEDALMFGPKGAKQEFSKVIPGPTLRTWVESIRAGHDALSTLGIGHDVGTESFIEDSESMGQFDELDTEDRNFQVPLVPIELRQISKAVPVSHWHDLAIEIMVFANALLKAKFF
ncbi:DUF4157 domain-containing protein [Duganella sp. CT11-25]|uniref:eCIS core domain-containing protein n=1 Tax=unclassified Duganella TaxID=2636909 RepID=UPI0039AF8574